VYRWIGGVLSGVAVLAMLAGGCGEGSETSSNLTKAEFVEQADAACAKRKKEWQKAAAAYAKEIEAKGAEGTPAVQRQVAEGTLRESLLPAFKDQLEQLENLGAPVGREKQVDKMLRTLATGIRELEDKGLERLLETKLATFDKQAKPLGITCSL
jgi:hypothetical protein